jgi:hypothetical protein
VALLDDGTFRKSGTTTVTGTDDFVGRGKGAGGNVTGGFLGTGGVFIRVESGFAIGVVVVV